MAKVRFIIENFEEMSDWVGLEYSHASKVAGKGNLTVCGISKAKIKGICFEKRHSWELSLKDPIILDPSAKEILEPEDFSEDCDNFVVIGGICGDFPPKARTGELLTKKFPGARVRSLGSLQLPTDIAVWTAREISKGKLLSEIPFFVQGEFSVGKYETVKINLGYPLVNGRPLKTPGLEKLLKKRKEF